MFDDSRRQETDSQRASLIIDLKLLVKELKYRGITLSDTKLLEELEQICFWASNEGSMSRLPDISKQVDDIKLKVRDLSHLLCFSIHIIMMFFYISVETTNQDGHVKFAPNCLY